MAALDEARARLNPHQRAIFDDLHERPTGSTPHRRILAGAGTGKTATIVTTLASLLETGVYRPEEVLLGTFTKKAAGEMEERLKKLVSATTFAAMTGRGQPRIGTFHKILGAWLRNNAQNLPHRHRWDPARNLEATPKDKERAYYIRIRDEAVRSAFGLRDRGQSLFKNKSFLYADILAAEADAWRFRDLRIPGMPAGVPEWIEENAPGLPVPSGGDYALGAVLLTAYGLTPTQQIDKPFQAPDPNDEDVMLTFNSVREYADAIEAAFGLPLLYKVWSTYEQIKSRLGAFDFDDVLIEYYRYGTMKAGLVLVDEAQDQSWVQVMTAHKIAGATGRVAMVGDVRQAIYGWRGGAPYLMRDADASKGYRTLVLPTNYRSGSAIVDIGNAICVVGGERATWAVGPDTDVGRREDPQRRREINVGSQDHPQLIPIYPSGLQTEGPRTEVPTGSVRVVAGGKTPLDEARTIGEDIQRLITGGVAYKDLAILVRTNALGGLIEIGCLIQRLPVMRVSRNGKPFFEDSNVMAVLGVLRAALTDDGSVLPLFINTPRRGVFTGKLRTALGAIKEPLGARDILTLIEREALASRDYIHEIPILRERLDEIRSVVWHEAPMLAVQTIQPAYGGPGEDADEDGDIVLAESSVEDNATYDALIQIAQQFDSLDELDRFAARLSTEVNSVTERLLANMTPQARAEFEADRERRVLICTVHASKGLEFGTVYVPCSDGTFPSARSTTPARLAEERRLFYVAATRAVDGLVFTYSEMTASGKPAGPSPFLQDTAGIPPANGIYLGGPPAEPVGAPVALIEEGGSPDPTPTPAVLPPQDDDWAETWQEYLTRFTDPPLSWTLLTSGSDFTREGILSFRLPTGATREGTRDPAGKWTLVHVAPDGSRLTMGTGLGDLELFTVLEEEVWPPADWRVALLDLLLAHPTRVTSFGGVDVPWSVAAEALLGWQRPPEPPRVIEAPVEDLVERETDPDADLDVSDTGARGLRRRAVTIDPGNLEILTRRGWTLGLILGPGTRTAFLELAKAPQIQEGAYLLQHHTSGSDYVIWHVWGNEISGPLRAGDLPSRDPLLPGMTRDVAAEANLLWYGSTGSFQLVPVSQDAGGIQTYHVLSSAGRFPSRNARPLRDALAALQEYGWIEHVGDGSWRWLDGAGTVG